MRRVVSSSVSGSELQRGLQTWAVSSEAAFSCAEHNPLRSNFHPQLEHPCRLATVLQCRHAPRPNELRPLQRLLVGSLHRGRLPNPYRPKDTLLSLRHPDGFRSFVLRCNPEDMPKFEHSVRAWGRGSNYVSLTDEQYGKLRDSVRKAPQW